MSDAPWLLVLGASSGLGAACCREFAAHGYNVMGVHLDRRSTMPQVDALIRELEAGGQEVFFFNGNAARAEVRTRFIQEMAGILAERGAAIRVVLHSLAFGSLVPLAAPGGATIKQRQLEMTLDVMASSLVYWARDLVEARAIAANGRIFALTSAGTSVAMRGYGAVSMAKAALDAVIRQLALELAPLGITANSILAGATATPALARIPGHEALLETARQRNPYGRTTRPEDVARCLLELSRPGTYWMTGNTIRVDGGETTCA